MFSRNWTARLFAVGFFCFVAGNMLGVFAYMYGHNWGSVSWAIGQVTLLFLFAVGLGYRLLESEREKAAAEKIRELDGLKTRFFTNISHEFRTPLSLILGPLQKAEESVPVSELENADNQIPVKAGYIQLMKRNALRLKQLIDQILDISKIESDKMPLRLEKGGIIKFIRSRVSEFEDISAGKQIHLVANYPPEIPQAAFDPDKLEKVLVNLLSNALKFTPAFGEIHVQVESVDPFLKIKVTDTGPGMTRTEADRIFDRFYQADNAQMQGTGIGMALVKELVELHQGRISVESQVGEGTTFSMLLCIDPNRFSPADFSKGGQLLVDPPTGFESISKSVPEFEPTSSLDIIKNLVLVVEDNLDLQSYIKEILSEEHQVITANNGLEGKELAMQKIPDLIVSDVMMPKMSGMELSDFLKKEEKTSHIPLILLTAKAERKDKLDGLMTGADDYLTKPFDAKELQVKVSNLIHLREKLKEKYSGMPWKLKTRKVSSLEDQFLKNVSDSISENLSNEYFSVEELALAIGYSRSQLFRKLKAITGKSPLDLIKEQRLHYAKELLEKGAATVSEVAFEVGYSNLSYFSRSFKKEFGVLPSALPRVG